MTIAIRPKWENDRLLRRIRDDAHRFALGYNRKRRQARARDEFEATGRGDNEILSC